MVLCCLYLHLLIFLSSFYIILIGSSDEAAHSGFFGFKGAIMATSQITTPTRPEYQVQAASSNNRHPNRAPVPPVRRPERNPFDPMKITYSHAWFQAGVAAALVGALGLRRFGWPLAVGLGGLGAASLAYMRRFEPAHPTL